MVNALDVLRQDTGQRLVRVVDAYGRKHCVREDHLADTSRVMLRRHTIRGRPYTCEDGLETIMLHRGNIAQA